ncbi:peptide ABC transporter ATP-binding protein [Shinella sp. SUS2]|jgi:peptide/nickel transport system ATP-binding protein|uniref:ABC transporter ATP-binding protein n=1 Tax=unclassified Shinella TaxID=2643062 RepID=UPI0006822F36|nr:MULTISPECIES: ABC transporter ATP-binding protein [unclassified Shinella]KNY14327.1 peptide ABC transporter ATP-binding protein [Shinella sp. SUS2]KOC73126.1 peptide ABC transporter ATP-binding protein [Shinella sp. GWS1]MCA0343930.1 ABC transporter ATP-binding protein [Pseudomonadota bacterium]MDG4675590.1 ABC transporter ATP-binding protein [Shinella sp. 838]
MAGIETVLSVENLSVRMGQAGLTVVDGLSFSLPAGEMLALVGESGSGKTMAARSVLGLLPPPFMATPESRIRFKGTDLVSALPAKMREIRGAGIGMVFQEPMVSLNPAMTIGRQMAEGLALHRKLGKAEIRDRSLAMLERIRIQDPARCLAAFPHEFSGGMRQRIMLASVMLLKPALLIADEPTTALDTLIQRDVLDLMVELTQENNTAVLLISHDLGMVSHYVRNVVVMHKGRAVEQGDSKDVLHAPKHDYTRRLVDALPRRSAGGSRSASAPAEALIELKDVVIDYPGRAKLFGRAAGKRAVHGVDLAINRGETLALVGASGSGKTTLGRAIVGLVTPSGGTMAFRGAPLAYRNDAGGRALRQSIQIVFQDPYSSLDPRQRIAEIVGEPLKLDPAMDRGKRQARVEEVFAEVGLAPELAGRFPHQLSGGQRQRVAIARAIVSRPAFVVADEPVSALDMTVQKQILKLFRDLQARYGFACLFVSHDLGAVEQVADRVAVMENGRIVEIGTRDDVFDRPQHAYTRRLLDAAMLLDRTFAGTDGAGSHRLLSGAAGL